MTGNITYKRSGSNNGEVASRAQRMVIIQRHKEAVGTIPFGASARAFIRK